MGSGNRNTTIRNSPTSIKNPAVFNAAGSHIFTERVASNHPLKSLKALFQPHNLFFQNLDFGFGVSLFGAFDGDNCFRSAAHKTFVAQLFHN